MIASDSYFCVKQKVVSITAFSFNITMVDQADHPTNSIIPPFVFLLYKSAAPGWTGFLFV